MGLLRWPVVKNPLANAGDAGDVGSILESRRSPGNGKDPHSSILAWKIPWTEESGRLQLVGCSQTLLKQFSIAYKES